MVYEINIAVLIYYREQQRLPLFKERQMLCGYLLLPLDHSPRKKQEGRGAAGLGTPSPGVRQARTSGRGRVSPRDVTQPSVLPGKSGEGARERTAPWPFQWTEQKGRTGPLGTGSMHPLLGGQWPPVTGEGGAEPERPAPAPPHPAFPEEGRPQPRLDFDPLRKRRETHSNRHGDKLISHARCSSHRFPLPLSRPPALPPSKLENSKKKKKKRQNERDQRT